MRKNVRPLKLGFIGVGSFVAGNHLPNAKANPLLEVYALCDLKDDRLQRLSQIYKPAYVTNDLRELVTDPNIDAVIIGTTETVRVEPIRAAAEARKPIFVEKPMARNANDALEIVRIINRARVPLMVGFNRPYSQPMQDTRELFRKTRGPETLVHYRIVSESRLWPEWWQQMVANNEANTIVNEVTHIFDLLNWLLEDYPRNIYAVGGRSDNHAIVMEYPKSTTVSILSGACGTESYPKENLEIFTNFSAIVMQSFVELLTAGKCDEGDRIYPLRTDPYADKITGEGIEVLRLKRRQWYANIPPEERKLGYYYGSRPSEDKGHYNELEHFRRCVVQGIMPETNHIRGAIATLTALKAIESLQTHRAVELDFSEFLQGAETPVAAGGAAGERGKK